MLSTHADTRIRCWNFVELCQLTILSARGLEEIVRAQVCRAMSKNYLKVSGTITLMEAMTLMHDNQKTCVLVVDPEDMLEGILTLGDVRRASRHSAEASSPPESDSVVSDVRGFSFQPQVKWVAVVKIHMRRVLLVSELFS